MVQQGTHTWPLIIHYHRCPFCGFILESRNDYEYRLGKYIKQLTCKRCKHVFTLTKPKRPHFGPLIGNSQPIEIDWNSDN